MVGLCMNETMNCHHATYSLLFESNKPLKTTTKPLLVDFRQSLRFTRSQQCGEHLNGIIPS